jgi:hypothetical protein
MQFSIERMVRKRSGIAYNDELHTGTGDSYIHAAKVGKKAYLPILV